MAEDTTCDRCGRVYNPFIGDRFWSGEFNETAPDGITATYETLCDDCHRDVVRA